MLPQVALAEIVAELQSRPRHEKVRSLIYRLLVDGLDVNSSDIDFETQVPEVRGRIDALLGRTVFEFKSDLRRERGDAEKALARYLLDRERQTHENYVGIATDGAEFVAYFLRDSFVVQRLEYQSDSRDPRELLVWLQGVVAVGEGVPAEPEAIEREFGRSSLAACRALDDLGLQWQSVAQMPEARIKRELWDRLLGVAYGADVGDDDLFLRHTYLAIVAKTIAWAALVDGPPASAADLLHGRAFSDYGIGGQSEPDFFDWVLTANGGPQLVLRIFRHVGRFHLRDVRTDVLKVLYESLIDPETRHDLGEYYTPDWLADRIIEEAVDEPLARRVLDPACGSGTFLFHAVRSVLKAADAAGVSPATAASTATNLVAGMDVHPVAVIFARVTYLLALLPALADEHPGDLSLPVYLGDALQWNLARRPEAAPGTCLDLFAGDDSLEIRVPAMTLTEPQVQRLAGRVLHFPAVVARDAQWFDRVVTTMIGFVEEGFSAEEFETWLRSDEQAKALSGSDWDALLRTLETLRELRREGRDHIWGYVARNLARPLWLSTDSRRADVIVGNPPWVAYRFMSGEFQERFKRECEALGLWVGGTEATQQDLSAYFFVRTATLYMKSTGRIAFVMPRAAMSRPAYSPFLTGTTGGGASSRRWIRFTGAWSFGSDVKPLFPVPSCVLFGLIQESRGELPATVTQFAGKLSRRNAEWSEVRRALVDATQAWPPQPGAGESSPYKGSFRQGATLTPRRLALVELVPQEGTLPPNPAAPVVRGRTGAQDKEPWANVVPPKGPVETTFLRPVLLGESIAPFRLLSLPLAVVPWHENELLNSRAAALHTYWRLSKWLEQTESLWEKHRKPGETMSLQERHDYFRGLSSQFPIAPLRVLYTTSGTKPTACVVRDGQAVVDTALYWAALECLREAQYLCGILNSETLRERLRPYQSQGQWGERHIHKYLLDFPIPSFDESVPLHRDLADVARVAEGVAADVEVDEHEYFVRARGRVREALKEAGVAARLEVLVAELLGS